MANQEADLLRAAGHEVLAHRVDNSPGIAGAAQLAVSTWNPAAGLRLRRVAEAFLPDVAHVHNTWFAYSPSVLRALRASRVPTVVTLHNYRLTCANGMLFRDGSPCELCVGSHPWHGTRYRCYRNSFLQSAASSTAIAVNRLSGTWSRDVELFVCLSEFAASLFRRAGLPAAKLRVVPNFATDPGTRSTLPSESDMALFVGRLSEEKGIEAMLRAWERSRPAGLRLQIVGDGPLRDLLAAQAGPDVSLLGHLSRDEVEQLMKTARVLLYPSRVYEGQPLVLLEALGSGLPVIAADVGAAAETLGDSSLILGGGDASAWESAIATIKDGAWLDQASRHARARYEDLYSPTVALDRLESLYVEASTARL